ncbi:MAG: HNH endonuclease [Opitutaceae bacterium]|jgi:hypothetical protein
MENADAPAPKKAKRVPPGRSQERRIWDESGSRCQFCGKPGIVNLQIHHLDEDPSNTVDGNLLAICGGCHESYKHGVISRNDAFKVKFYLTEGKPPFPLLASESKAVTRVKKTSIKVKVNKGQVAETIINKNYGTSKNAPIILPGTVATDPDRYNYLEYLMERLAEYREAGASFGQKRRGKIHVGVIRNMVKNDWGALPKNLKLGVWDDVVAELKAKIDYTALGRVRNKQGKRRYHSFEDHVAKGGAEE